MGRQKGDNVEVKEILRYTSDLRVNVFTWIQFVKTEIDTIDSELTSVEERIENIRNQDGNSYERVKLEAEKLVLISDRKTIVNAMNLVFSDIKVLEKQVPNDEMARLHATMKSFMKSQNNRN